MTSSKENGRRITSTPNSLAQPSWRCRAVRRRLGSRHQVSTTPRPPLTAPKAALAYTTQLLSKNALKARQSVGRLSVAPAGVATLIATRIRGGVRRAIAGREKVDDLATRCATRFHPPRGCHAETWGTLKMSDGRGRKSDPQMFERFWKRWRARPTFALCATGRSGLHPRVACQPCSRTRWQA